MNKANYIIVLLVLYSCTNSQSEKLTGTKQDTKSKINSKSDKRIEIEGREMKCGLYIDIDGDIYFKTIDNSNNMDSIRSNEIEYAKLNYIYNADKSDTNYGGLMKMKYVVDTSTFKIVNTFYFKDKNHVYDFTPMVDGGTIAVNSDIDVKTFKALACEYFAKDKRHCYYRGNIIEGADLKSFKVLDSLRGSSISYDKNNVYEFENKLTAKEIKEEKLDYLVKKKKYN